MSDCIFCKIISGEIPSSKVYEDEHTCVIMDTANDVDGHMLAIPKQHIGNILDCDDESLNYLIKTVKLVANHCVCNCGFDGVNLLNASGNSAGQSVPHFHIHIIPRKNGDGIDAWPAFNGGQSNIYDMFTRLKIKKVIEMKIKAGIVGATGYAGAELVRLLTSHPQAEISAISSVSFEGEKLSQVYPAYAFLNDMVCENQDAVVEKSDVIFAALPHGLSQELAAKCIENGKKFIDLGADFRLESEDEYTEWYGGTFLDKELHKQSVYGLPEFFRDKIKGKSLIANPGCYTTCSPLAIAPAIANGLVSTKGIICDCKSGVTGAGRKPNQGNHYPELNEGFHAYKVASHRHTPEIEQTLSKLSGEDVTITFVPHLLPVNRGILATVYADINDGVTFEQIRKAYEDYYKDEFFVRLLDDGKCADIHNIKYSNFCDVSIHHDKRANKLVACAAIDNMVKGAAGQAIQNMNIIFDLDETTGLVIVPPAF